MKYCALLLISLLSVALAGPAKDISSIRITDCDCSRCLFTQIGYPLRGSVRAKFNGSKVDCSKTPITDFRRIVTGWKYRCPINGSSGGKFEVSYNNKPQQICGQNYDRVSLRSCKGTPCSAFG